MGRVGNTQKQLLKTTQHWREERTEGFKRISYQPDPNSIMGDRATGPLGVDPLHYVCVVFGLLICWVGYLLLPKGMRQQHFNAYPKRFRWSARPRTKRGDANGGAGKGQVSSMAAASNTHHFPSISTPLALVGWSVSVIFYCFRIPVPELAYFNRPVFLFTFYTCHLTNRSNNHHQ